MKKIFVLLILLIFATNSNSQYSSQFWMQNNVGYFTNYGSPIINDASFINAGNGAVIIYDASNRNKISIWKTLNKGSGWYNATGDFSASTPSYNHPVLKFINANIGFVITVVDHLNGYNLKIFKTTNAGINTTNNSANWFETQTLYDYCDNIPTLSIKFINENTGYISTEWSIFKTTNCGQSWNIVLQWNPNNPFKIYDFQISSNNPDEIFAAGGYYNIPKVLKSVNGGSDWEIYATGSTNGAYSVKKLSLINENNTEIIRGIADNGVVRCESGEVNLISSPNFIIPGYYTDIVFWNSIEGFLTAKEYVGSISQDYVYRTTNGGLNWEIEDFEHWTSYKVIQKFSRYGDIVYALGGIVDYDKTIFFDVRKINVNLLSRKNYTNENTPSSSLIKMDVFDYLNSNPLFNVITPANVNVFGGNLNVSFSQSSSPGDDYVFYKWDNYLPSQNPMIHNYYNVINSGYNIIAHFKQRQVSTTQNAISEKSSTVNSPQIRMLRDNNGYIHQIHESMGGIFYTRSTNDGTNWFKEEIVNGGSEYLSGFPNENTTDYNSNPSICELRKLNNEGGPFPLSDANINTAASWQRYNNGIMELKVAFRQNSGNDIFWRRYGTSGNYQTHTGIIRSFTVSSQDYESKPAIFAAWYDFPWGAPYYQESNINNPIDYMILIPHLEPASSGNKLVVSTRLRTYPLFDYITNQMYQDVNFLIEESGVTDFSVTSKPYISGVNRGFILYFSYIKNGNIMYRADKFVTISGSPPGFARMSYDENPDHSSINISANDGQISRISPDISLRNGRPIVTYRGKSLIQRWVQIGNGEDYMLNLWNYPIFVRYKYKNTSNQEVWSTRAIYHSVGTEQKFPNIEGCRNGNAYLLNYKYNNQYRQVAYLQSSPGYCIPGQYTVNDAKLVRGSFYGATYPHSSPMLLTLTQSASLYNIGKQTFSVSNIPSNSMVQDNLVGTIREENTNYNFNLGPVIAKNTNVTFATESETSVTNPVDFSNTMVSAPFSLGPNDTLILGGNGFYNYVSGNPFLQKRYSIFLMRNSTQEPYMTLYSDSIGVVDTIETEYLRGYVFSEGEMPEVDSFYIQLVIDSTSLYQGDGFSVCNAYSPDELIEGDGPNSYKSRVHFVKGSHLNNISNIPKEYSLSQNYPNPFNPVTNIKYQIPVNGFVSLKIYDITGREIANLVKEYKQAGYYTVSFNGSNFASGVYFYRIQAGDFVQVKKMVLIK